MRGEKSAHREILANAVPQAHRVQGEKSVHRAKGEKSVHRVPLAPREPQLLSTFMKEKCSRDNKEKLVPPDHRVLSAHVGLWVSKAHKVLLDYKVHKAILDYKVHKASWEYRVRSAP